jgi:hypothetical protein
LIIFAKVIEEIVYRWERVYPCGLEAIVACCVIDNTIIVALVSDCAGAGYFNWRPVPRMSWASKRIELRRRIAAQVTGPAVLPWPTYLADRVTSVGGG